MAKRVVTLYIADTSLRLLVTQGKRIKKWADLPLEPGLVKNAVVVKEAEVAARLKQLLQDQKVKTKKVIVGLSGLHCLSRPINLPQLPKAMLAEAVMREAKRVLPVPLEQLYISWQTIPAPEGKLQVFLVAIPCKTADALLSMLRQAGLKAHLMDIKPLALARVAGEATAVIVDVQPTEFDIIIMADGIPQPIRTVPLPSAALSWTEKLPLIRDELDKTIKFFNANNPEKLLAASVPIFVSGELADDPELCQSLSDDLGYPVLPLSSPLKCPERLAPNHYLANIGLALKELSSVRGVGFSVANLNVLPTAYRPKPISLTRIFVLPSAVVFIGLLIPLAMLIQDDAAAITSIRNQLDTTNQLLEQGLSQKQELMENITELEPQIAEAEASRDRFVTALGSLGTQNNGVNGTLAVAVDSVPSTISLTGIGHADSTLTVNGRSPSEAEVLAYLRRLDASDRFSEITIASMKLIEGGEMDFSLALSSMDTPNNEGNTSLAVTVSSLPSAVSLTSISHTDTTLTVSGSSPGEAEVLAYLRNLEASGKFSEATIASMMRNKDDGMDFILVLRVGG